MIFYRNRQFWNSLYADIERKV